MKLPQLTAGNSPKSLAQKSLSGPAQIANSKMDLAKAAGGLANQIAEQAATHQVKTADSDVMDQMSTWSAENDDVQYYDAEDLRSRGVSEDIIRGRDSVAAYEVRPTLFKMKSEEVIANNASKITPGKFRSDFAFKQNNASFEEQAMRTVQASQEQREQENLEVMTDVNRLVQDGKYTQAIVRSDDLQVPQNKKDDLILNLRDEREFGEYEQIVIRRGPEAIKDANDALQYLYKSFDRENGQGILQPGDKFQAADQRSLDETRTRQAIAMLENFISWNDPNGGGKGLSPAPDVRATIKAENHIFGHREEVDTVDRLRVDAVNYPIQPGLIQKLDATRELNRLTLGIMMKPFDEQLALSRNFKSYTESKKGRFAPEWGNVGDQALTNYNARYQAAESDMMQYVMDATPDGVVSPFLPGGLMGPDGKPADDAMNRMYDMVKERKEVHDIGDAQFGTSKGYLSDYEVGQWTNYLNNLGSQELIANANVISAAFGPDAGQFWEQLERMDTFNPGTLSIVGRMATKNKEHVSEMILLGKQKRVKYSSPLLKKMEFYNRQLNEKLGGAFLSDPRYGSAIKEAILDVYTHLHPDVTGEWNDTANGNLLDRAIGLVTNGMYDFDGTIIELPDGVNGVTFERKVFAATPDFWNKNMGGINGEDGAQFIERLDDGVYRPRNVGDNKYIFEDTSRLSSLGTAQVLLSNIPIKGADGRTIGYEPYVFRYDESMSTSLNSGRGVFGLTADLIKGTANYSGVGYNNNMNLEGDDLLIDELDYLNARVDQLNSEQYARLVELTNIAEQKGL